MLTRRGGRRRGIEDDSNDSDTTEGLVYIQSPLCYTTGIVLIRSKACQKKTQRR